MGELSARHLLNVLDGEFAAALVSADDAAAEDLAFSLAQDVPVVEDLRREGGSVRVAGATCPVTRLGHDFLEAGPWLVPTERAVVSVGGQGVPEQFAQVFLGRLRGLARRRAWVTVGVGGENLCGCVEKATPAHLVVRGPLCWAIPLPRIDYVRLALGGSKDGL